MSLSDRDLELAIKAIDDYFVSGNDVPVERATIKREEWEAVKVFLAERDAQRADKVQELEINAISLAKLNGRCEVSIKVGGKWVKVIEDSGTVISHIVEKSGIEKAIEATKGVKMSDFKRERKYMVPDGWLRAIDEELVMTCNGTADYEDDYDTAKGKLDQLIQWHIAVATDPKVNGGFSLQPADKVRELEMFIELAFEAHPNLDLDIEAIKAMKGE